MEKLYAKYEQYDDIEVRFFEPSIMINNDEENISNTNILKEVFNKNNLYITKNNMILLTNVTDKLLEYISNWYYKLTISYTKDFSKPDRIYKHMTIFVKDKNGITGGPVYKLSPFIISQEKREVIFEII